MKRLLISFVMTALLVGLLCIDVSAAKKSRRAQSSRSQGSRSQGSRSRGSSFARANKQSRGRSIRGHSARSHRNERGLSRRERRELARDRGMVRERIIVRGKRGRRLVRYRYVRRSEPDLTASAPRPAAPRQTGGGIPTERVTEIQNALIKAGYLEGPASGQYDDNTIQAMKQFQESNKLSQTGMPSASTLKKLGVAKRSNDGYAMPVNSVSENDKKRP